MSADSEVVTKAAPVGEKKKVPRIEEILPKRGKKLQGQFYHSSDEFYK